MRAVILVGGEGTRLRPLTCHTPKPMLPLGNRPFLEHVLDYLKGHGINDVVLSMCYRPDIIQSHFGDGSSFGLRLTYEVESVPLGTAGGVKNVAGHLDETFFVFNGDVLTDLDLGAMLEHHRSAGAQVTIALTSVSDPTAYGLVETSPEGRIQQFIEKPSWDRVTTNLINAGTYILEPAVLRHIPPNSYYMFERGLFPLLLERGDLLLGYPSNAYWMDIGTPQKYLAVHHDVLESRIATCVSGTQVRGGIWLASDATIHPSAKLTPPIVLGKGVRVAAGANLIGPLAIGDECAIGCDAVVEESVLWRGTTIGDRSTVRGSLLGAGCTVSADSCLTGGVVVGDGCSIGTGNRLEQGIRIWPGRNIEPNTISF